MTDGEKIQSIKKTHPFKLWDLCVYAVVVVAVAGLLIAVSKPRGATVRIQYYDAGNNRVTVLKPLDKDSVVELPLGDGGHYKIIIKDGKVWTEESNCRDKVCMAMGKISRVNRQIICLPRGVIITILGESTTDIIIA